MSKDYLVSPFLFPCKRMFRKCRYSQKGTHCWGTAGSILPGSPPFLDGSSSCPPGWVSQPSMGSAGESVVQVLSGRGKNALKLSSWPALLKKTFSQVLSQRGGNSIKWHFSGTESSLWICAFGHFHLHLPKQTHHQHLLVLHLLGSSPLQIMKGSSGKIMIFFLHLTGCGL